MPAELDASRLRRSYDPQSLPFATTAEIEPVSSIIGQPRGVQAIEFGLNMRADGYNIYALGPAGTGRTTAIKHFVEHRSIKNPVPNDWAYVHNFLEPDKPLAITLPPGKASVFRDSLYDLIRRLRGEIAQAFDNQAFRDAALEVRHALDNKQDALFQALQAKARSMNAVVLSTQEGLKIVPGQDGQPLSPQDLAAFSEEQSAAWRETFHTLQHEMNETSYQARKLDNEAQQELDDLKRRVAGSVVDGALAEFKSQYQDHAKILEYLEALHNDVLDNVDLFRLEEEEETAPNEEVDPERFRRYQVNVLVDHQQSTHAPVLVEFDLSLPHLLGRVEHEPRRGGAIVTDFTLIRSGALHQANGGYLVLRARDLFAEPGAWEMLKRALIGEAIIPDDPATRSGTAVRTLNPEPIPLDIKVILVGPPALYYLLHEEDEDFSIIFKVMADFDEEVDRTPENENDYATFVATRVQEEGLRHLDQAAVGRVLEFGSRLAGTQKKLSTRFGQIADLVREANYWAGMAGKELVTVEDVEKAIDHREYLNNRIETRQREQLVEGKQLVATTGLVTGQINGLAVSQIGDHAFGHPSRLTARTYVGREGVVQIDREVDLAGPIHNKGLLTLVGYLGGQYAEDLPLSLSAQITFEQNYGGIDGDSASSTELYALLSSLSCIPIDQGIAVTGSVNQNGEIQAIGGVTQKVEGWYAVCKAQGLTGEQGVLIPAANVDDLMLRVGIVEAVAAGQFHVWAVKDVDEGLEVLTKRPAAEVHTAVKERLRILAENLDKFKDDPAKED